MATLRSSAHHVVLPLIAFGIRSAHLVVTRGLGLGALVHLQHACSWEGCLGRPWPLQS